MRAGVSCRKKRLYAAQDIAALVAKEAGNAACCSGSSCTPEQWSQLHVFDDTSFETRTAEQWVPSTPGAAQGTR
jgi:hypothetical protein